MSFRKLNHKEELKSSSSQKSPTKQRSSISSKSSTLYQPVMDLQYGKMLQKLKSKHNNEKSTSSTLKMDVLADDPYKRKLAYKLRLAITEGGGSNDPVENAKLRKAITTVMEMGMKRKMIDRILREYDPYSQNFDDSKTYVLQFRYQRKIFFIVKVISDNFEDFYLNIAPLLKKHGTGTANTDLYFSNTVTIQATLSYRTLGDFANLEDLIANDARECHAKKGEFSNYEKGIIQFDCDNRTMFAAREALEDRGYKILNLLIDFKPFKRIALNWQEREGYENFLHKLRRFPEVEQIFDNVLREELMYQNPNDSG